MEAEDDTGEPIRHSSSDELMVQYVGVNGAVGLGRVGLHGRTRGGAGKCFHTTGIGRVIVYPWLA